MCRPSIGVYELTTNLIPDTNWMVVRIDSECLSQTPACFHNIDTTRIRRRADSRGVLHGGEVLCERGRLHLSVYYIPRGFVADFTHV
jgi:hypothetical protein